MFSVIIPIHNKLPHLERSIKSVLNQSFKEFELILIDDASTDGSTEKIKEFYDPKIRRFRRDVPGPGGYAARNLGIEKAQGDWVAFLDADDEWDLNHLEKMNKLALDYPEVYFMSCGWYLENKKGKRNDLFSQSYTEKDQMLIDCESYLRLCLSNKKPVWTSVACIIISSPVLSGLFPEKSEARRGGDLHAWLKIICYHNKLAWSNHRGATYHLESVNMVTKTALSSTVLMSRLVYNDLSTTLQRREKCLLRKYLNYLIFGIVKRSKSLGQRVERIEKKVYWKGDLFKALLIITYNYTPNTVIKKMKKLFSK